MVAVPVPFKLVAAVAPPQPAPTTNRIFNYNASTEPGQGLFLQGSFSAGATFWAKTRLQPTPIQVFPWSAGGVTLQAENSAILRMPEANVLAYEVYEIYVVDAGKQHTSVFINRAAPWFADCTEVAAGGTGRLYGRNLLLTPGLTTVWFTPVGGGGAVSAVLDAGACTNYFLKYQVPALAPKAYRISVSNGYGNAERIELEDTVTVLAPGADLLGIGDRVGWYSKYDFVNNVYDIRFDERLGSNGRHPGDGSDARAKIQAALQLASNAVVNGVRGGIVKITGVGCRYLINGGITVPSFAGLWCEDGQLYVAGTSPNQANAINLSGTRCVLRTINYQNDSDEDTLAPHQNFGAFGCSEPLILGGNWDLGEGLRMDFRNCYRPVVLDIQIQQGVTPHIDARQGPVLMLDCNDIVVDSSDEFPIDYKVGAWSIWSSTGVVAGLRMRWNGYEGNEERVVNHVLAVDNCHKLSVRLSHFSATYDPDFKDVRSPKKQGPGQGYFAGNDGEGIIAETPGGSDMSIVGIATGWTTTGMRDAGKYFSAMTVGKILYIVAGVGAGQWRRIVAGGTDTELKLDRPWDVVPSAEGATPSRYMVSSWTSDRLIIEGNKFRFLKRGVLWYFNNCKDSLIVNNDLFQSGMLDLTTRSTRDGGLAQNGPQRFQVMYGPDVIGNLVDGRGDTKQAAGILFHQVNYVQTSSFGTTFFGGRILNNEVYNDDPGLEIVIDAFFDSGIYCAIQYQSAGSNFVDNPAIPTMVGMIIAGNKVVGSKHYARTGTGNLNMLVLNNRYQNCPDGFRKETLSGNSTPGRNILEFNTMALAA